MWQEEKFRMLENRLQKVNRHITRQARRMEVSCYRIYDHDLPEFPFCLDRYEDRLHLAEYKRHHGMNEEEHGWWIAESLKVVSSVLEVPRDRIYVKERKRQSSRLNQYEKQDSVREFFPVSEGGLKFLVNLSDYLDTGLFLDHRVTRSLVREGSAGKRVLNLFSYTGSFSVYAAAGGATEIESVDLSNTYLNWSRENLKLNLLYRESVQRFVRSDVVRYLPGIPDNQFDLVILDPPTFSNSKGMAGAFEIQRDHVELINQALRVTREGGELYFSTNFTKFELQQDLIKAKQITDITKMTTPFDFQGAAVRWCYRMRK